MALGANDRAVNEGLDHDNDAQASLADKGMYNKRDVKNSGNNNRQDQGRRGKARQAERSEQIENREDRREAQVNVQNAVRIQNQTRILNLLHSASARALARRLGLGDEEELKDLLGSSEELEGNFAATAERIRQTLADQGIIEDETGSFEDPAKVESALDSNPDTIKAIEECGNKLAEARQSLSGPGQTVKELDINNINNLALLTTYQNIITWSIAQAKRALQLLTLELATVKFDQLGFAEGQPINDAERGMENIPYESFAQAQKDINTFVKGSMIDAVREHKMREYMQARITPEQVLAAGMDPSMGHLEVDLRPLFLEFVMRMTRKAKLDEELVRQKMMSFKPLTIDPELLADIREFAAYNRGQQAKDKEAA